MKSGDSSSSDEESIEPAASPPVKDVSTDPGTSGEDIEKLAMGDGPDDSSDDGGDFGTADLPDNLTDPDSPDPQPGSGSSTGSTSGSGSPSGSTGGSNGGGSADLPDNLTDPDSPDPQPGSSGSSEWSDGSEFNPAPGAYDDETSVGSTEDERTVKDVTTGYAGDVSNVVGVDQSVVTQIDEQFAGVEITADDLQYTSNELQLTPEAKDRVRDFRRGDYRVSTGGIWGERALEREVERKNPGFDIDVGRSADGSFAFDVVDSPGSSNPAMGDIGADLAKSDAEREAREKVAEKVNEQFPNADLVAGEDFTTSVTETDSGFSVSAELTDTGRKEIAKENAPLQNTPLEGVTEFGAGLNFEYEEFRRGLHGEYDDLVSPAKTAFNENTPDTQAWWNENTPDAPDVNVKGPSAGEILGASAVGFFAPEPTSTASGAVVGGATLAGLGLLSLAQDPKETRTDAELAVGDPSQSQSELPAEDFDRGFSEIAVGDGDVTEVEPGDGDVMEISIPEGTVTEVGVAETGAAGTDTGSTPAESPFSPGVGPETPGIEDVEDPTVTEDESGFIQQPEEKPGTVTEGEVGGETTGDEAFEVDTPSVSENAASEDTFGQSDSFGLAEGLANVGSGALNDVNANARAAAVADTGLGLNIGEFGNPYDFGSPNSFGFDFGTPTTTDYGFDFPFDYGFDFGTPRQRPRAPGGGGGFDLSLGDTGFGLGSTDSGSGPAINWFNETVATAATESTRTFTAAEDDTDMFGFAPIAVSDKQTREEIDEAFAFFRG